MEHASASIKVIKTKCNWMQRYLCKPAQPAALVLHQIKTTVLTTCKSHLEGSLSLSMYFCFIDSPPPSATINHNQNISVTFLFLECFFPSCADTVKTGVFGNCIIVTERNGLTVQTEVTDIAEQSNMFFRLVGLPNKK